MLTNKPALALRGILGLAMLTIFSSATATAQPRKPWASDIHEIDFRNFTYAPACAYNNEQVHVRDGNFERNRGDDKISFEVRDVTYGDLTGDGQDEAVVVTNCNTGGTGEFSEGFIFTLRGGRAMLLTSFAGGDRAFGGLHQASVEGGQLVVERYAPEAEGVGACCPKYIETTRYRWNGRRLVQVGKTIRKPFESERNRL